MDIGTTETEAKEGETTNPEQGLGGGMGKGAGSDSNGRKEGAECDRRGSKFYPEDDWGVEELRGRDESEEREREGGERRWRSYHWRGRNNDYPEAPITIKTTRRWRGNHQRE